MLTKLPRVAALASAVILAPVLALTLSGCQDAGNDANRVASDPAPTAGETTDAAPAKPTLSADELLAQLVETYRNASSYEDAGELFVAVQETNGRKQSTPGIPFSVTFERPNKVRIHALDANVVSDGDKLRAVIMSLAEQVLVLPAPERLTTADILSDPMLADAMRGQLEFAMPQLALLLDQNPIEQLTGSARFEVLDDAAVNGINCHRVAADGPAGRTVFWIDSTTGLLVKYEFPSNVFKEQNQLAAADIWVEMKGARVDRTIVADAFKMEIPEGSRLQTRFLAPPPVPPSPLLTKRIDDFTLLDYRGGSVSRESLEGKVAVLDMWATWCGWCFEGFPNLERVHQQFKDNDRVAILAVNKDEPTVSDAQVKKSFADAGITVPIVRDQQQLTDRVFQIQGLPTMVILSPEGTVEEYHIGFDANLGETLPKKIERLLAGESLAKEEIERYEAARKKYEQELSDALVGQGQMFAPGAAQ